MNKVISIRFKDKNKVFRGKTYDYILHPEEEIPKRGDIVRMMDTDYNYIHYGTRTRVENIRDIKETDVSLETVRLIKTTLN